MITTRSAEAEELISITNALLAKRATSEAVRAAQASDVGYDPHLWATLCEQIGVAALPLSEEYDGAEASLNETGAVLEALAYHLVPTPLFTSTLAQCAVLLWGTDQARAEFLPRMASGEVATVMWPGLADGALLNPSASLIFTIENGQLCAVTEPEFAPEETMDQGVRIGRLTGGAKVVISDEVDADALTAIARAMIAVMASGVAARGLDMTNAYVKERVQFGRPIGSFQAIKHRLADCLVMVEAGRSASWAAMAAAADFVASPSTAARERLVALARVASSYCNEGVAHIASETVQLHGGIAITWEHDAHLIFKTAHTLGVLAGAPHTVRNEMDR
jgi:hypothetical protein